MEDRNSGEGPKGTAGNRSRTGTGDSIRAAGRDGQDECRMDLIVRHKHCEYYQYCKPGSLVPAPLLF